jgi:hypothetical protein
MFAFRVQGAGGLRNRGRNNASYEIVGLWNDDCLTASFCRTPGNLQVPTPTFPAPTHPTLAQHAISEPAVPVLVEHLIVRPPPPQRGMPGRHHILPRPQFSDKLLSIAGISPTLLLPPACKQINRTVATRSVHKAHSKNLDSQCAQRQSSLGDKSGRTVFGGLLQRVPEGCIAGTSSCCPLSYGSHS